MKKITSFSLLITFCLACFIFAAYAYDLPKWFPFNAHNSLQEWQEKVFKGKVLYDVRVKGGDGFLSAHSHQACSGLFYKLKFDVTKHPMISWHWKITKFPEKRSQNTGDVGWLEKDDYAARVYVIFSSWNFMKTKSLEYIWDENLREETVMASPYLDNIKLIVVESGKTNVDQWVFEERNILEDYKKAFGKSPPRYVTAIALMTDADNTLSTAEAFYQDIKVGYKK